MPKEHWDWALYFYIGTVILHMSPRQFWHITPRKFGALCDVHVDLNATDENKKERNKRTEKQVYVDQLSFM